MKRIQSWFFTMGSLLLLAMAGLLPSCVRNINIPAGPIIPTYSPTPTKTATPNPDIRWKANILQQMANGGPLLTVVGLELQTYGATDPGATVILNGSMLSKPITLPYVHDVVESGGSLYALYQTTGFTYQVGASYSLTSITSAGTASQTLTAPGNDDVNPSGTIAIWTGGNENTVQVFNSAPVSTYAVTGTLVSPFSIPATAYPLSGTYDVQVISDNRTTSILNGSGQFDVRQVDNQSVTIP